MSEEHIIIYGDAASKVFMLTIYFMLIFSSLTDLLEGYIFIFLLETFVNVSLILFLERVIFR